jgi:hypothetical protein
MTRKFATYRFVYRKLETDLARFKGQPNTEITWLSIAESMNWTLRRLDAEITSFDVRPGCVRVTFTLPRSAEHVQFEAPVRSW